MFSWFSSVSSYNVLKSSKTRVEKFFYYLGMLIYLWTKSLCLLQVKRGSRRINITVQTKLCCTLCQFKNKPFGNIQNNGYGCWETYNYATYRSLVAFRKKYWDICRQVTVPNLFILATPCSFTMKINYSACKSTHSYFAFSHWEGS